MQARLPTDIVIRSAVLADSPAIFDAHQDSVRHLCAGAYTPSQLQTWFEGRTHEIHHPAIVAGQVLIAERAGRVLGFCGFVPGEITLLFVRPEAAGSGLGSQLFALAVEYATVGHQGALNVVATTNSQGFYEKQGFIAIEPSFFVRGASDMHFEVVKMRREVG